MKRGVSQNRSHNRSRDATRGDRRRNALAGLADIAADWNGFWFAARSATLLNGLRVGICMLAALWWLTFFASTAAWFGSDGILPVALTGKLIEFEETARWQHWSPLWWTDNVMLIRSYLCLGALLSVLAAVGLGGRIVIGMLWLCVIGWVHRIAWLQGPFEPALVALLGYLLVSPGTPLWGSRSRQGTEHWLYNLAVRLIQVHVWILLAAGVLSQLGNVVWWRGDAIWWLAASGRSHLLSLEWLQSSASLVNALTHGMVFVQLLTLGLLLRPSTRWLGMMVGVLSALGIGLLADQALYASLLAVSIFAFRPSSPSRIAG